MWAVKKIELRDLRDFLAKIRRWLYGGAVLVLFIVLTLAGHSFTKQSSYCDTCHVMRPYIKAWQQSNHARIPCYDCHKDGAGLRLYSNARMVWLNLSGGYEKPINGHSELSRRINSETCESCHGRRKVTPSKGMIIAHKVHAKKRINCAYCHNRTAHARITGYVGEYKAKAKEIVFDGQVIKAEAYPDRMKMRYCMECHTGGKGPREGPEECSACHTPKFGLKPKNHFAVGFLVRQPVDGEKQIHGEIAKVDLGYCRMCHISKSCVDCHGLPLPHEAVWPGIHGKNAVADAPLCFRCHKKELCVRCHVVAYPHPLQWVFLHGREARARSEDSCSSCHRVSQFCQGCHAGVEMPHPQTWFAQHPLYLQDNPSEACVGCHSRDQCELCHASHAVHNRQTLYDFSRIGPE